MKSILRSAALPATPPVDPALSRHAPEAVRELFSRVAPRYDLLNHVLCAGTDCYWRACLVRAVREQAPTRVLDVATGSGDILRALNRLSQVPALAAGLDFCLPMLQLARKKKVANLVGGDALRLPFAAGTWDAVTLAFGIRNLADRLGTLREIRRVLRPGGRLYALEFSHPIRLLAPFYFAYLRWIMPRFARLFTSERGAYEYLAESIQAFPRQAAFADLFREAGFREISWRNLTFGVVALHIGEV